MGLPSVHTEQPTQVPNLTVQRTTVTHMHSRTHPYSWQGGRHAHPFPRRAGCPLRKPGKVKNTTFPLFDLQSHSVIGLLTQQTQLSCAASPQLGPQEASRLGGALRAGHPDCQGHRSSIYGSSPWELPCLGQQWALESGSPPQERVAISSKLCPKKLFFPQIDLKILVFWKKMIVVTNGGQHWQSP